MRLLVAVVLVGIVFAPIAAVAKAGRAASAAPIAVPPPSADVLPALTGETGLAAGKAVEIRGFRSARFGMVESAVRKAIRADFGKGGTDVVSATDELEKNTSLQIGVDDLLSVAGKGKISYVFGLRSKKLTQINIAWGAAAGVETSSGTLVDAASMLRDHFLMKPFRREDMLIDWQLADGSTVVFRGMDRHRHVVLLVLAGEKETLSTATAAAAAASAPAEPTLKITTLMLSYIQDLRHPDDFHLKPEEF